MTDDKFAHHIAGMPRERFTRPIGGVYQLADGPPLGIGGQGTVFRATDIRDGTPAAVKIFAQPQTAEAIAVIEREATIQYQLRRHPHIITSYQFGVETVMIKGHRGRLMTVHHPYIAMELATDKPLSERMREWPMSIPAIRSVIVEIGGAAHFAHINGYIIRDLKPSNVLGKEGRNLLADFGIAKAMPTETTQPSVQTLIGTPKYISPEQARGEVLDPSSDVYAMGMMLYEMLACVHPFSVSKVAELVEAHDKMTVPLLDTLPTFENRTGPERHQALALQHVALKALDKDRMRRQQTAKQMVWEFEERYQAALEEHGISYHDMRPATAPAVVEGWVDPTTVDFSATEEIPHSEDTTVPRASAPPAQGALYGPGGLPKANVDEAVPSSEQTTQRPRSNGRRHRRIALVGAAAVIPVVLASIAWGTLARPSDAGRPPGTSEMSSSAVVDGSATGGASLQPPPDTNGRGDGGGSGDNGRSPASGAPAPAPHSSPNPGSTVRSPGGPAPSRTPTSTGGLLPTVCVSAQPLPPICP